MTKRSGGDGVAVVGGAMSRVIGAGERKDFRLFSTTKKGEENDDVY